MSAPTPSEARLAHWNGIPVIVNDIAVTRVCKVESVPIRKRRKGYRVRAHFVPAVWQMGYGMGAKLVMHPALYEKLRKEMLS